MKQDPIMINFREGSFSLTDLASLEKCIENVTERYADKEDPEENAVFNFENYLKYETSLRHLPIHIMSATIKTDTIFQDLSEVSDSHIGLFRNLFSSYVDIAFKIAALRGADYFQLSVPFNRKGRYLSLTEEVTFLKKLKGKEKQYDIISRIEPNESEKLFDFILNLNLYRR